MTSAETSGSPDGSPIDGWEARSLADVTDRLIGEFAGGLSASVVVATVRHCRRELDIVSGPAMPEMVERLARQRLRAVREAEPR